MLKKILMGVAAVISIFVVVVMIQPDDFRTSRSIAVAASPQKVFEQVNDLHKWEVWSPWVKIDPNSKTTYEGPAQGEGAVFKWSGNDQVGVGLMTITESRPDELVRFKLEFLKPFQGTSTAEFTFKEENGQTIVTWSMFGQNNFIGKAMSLVMNCDKMMGGQFEQGLAQLKSVVENP